MTSPATTLRCARCGAEFTSHAAVALHGLLVRHHLDMNATPVPCGGVVVDIARDDRAGVTLPTAVEPVGGDQLVPGGAGQGDQGGEAGEHTTSVDPPADPVHASPCADLTHADARSAS